MSKFLFALSFSAALMIGALACAGRDIHPDLKADPKIMVRKWTLQTHGPYESGDRGTEFSNPVLSGNTLIFGNQSVGLVSLYPGMMQVRWSLPIRGGVISELSVDRGIVFFGGGDGYLYSVSAESGTVNWRYDLHNSIISRPTVVDGRVFVTTSDDTVFAFDAGTGKWLWHYRRRSAPPATILGASAPLVDGQEVLAGLSDGFLVALSVQDGQLRWEKKLHQGSRFVDVDAHPVLEGGILYIPSYDGSLYALKRQGGEILWRFESGGSKQVFLEDQNLYLPSSDGSIYALQKTTARLLWKFELDRGTPTQLIVTDKYVMVGSSHQYFYVLDKKSGKGIYRFNVGYDNGFYGSPAFDAASQRLYTLSSAGNLYSFYLRQPPRKTRLHGMLDPYEFQ